MNPDPVLRPSGKPLRTRSPGERFLGASSAASHGGPEPSLSSAPPEIHSPDERLLREARERDDDQVAELGELLARWEVACSHRLRAMAARCASDGDVAGPGTEDLLKGMTSEEVDAVVLFVGRAVDRAYRQAWCLRDLRPKR